MTDLVEVIRFFIPPGGDEECQSQHLPYCNTPSKEMGTDLKLKNFLYSEVIYAVPKRDSGSAFWVDRCYLGLLISGCW